MTPVAIVGLNIDTAMFVASSSSGAITAGEEAEGEQQAEIPQFIHDKAHTHAVRRMVDFAPSGLAPANRPAVRSTRWAAMTSAFPAEE